MGGRRSDVLGDIIAKNNLGIGAEIGVGTGPTTERLLSRFKSLLWIGVDHFPAGFDLVDGDKMTEERQKAVRVKYAQKVSRFAPRLRHIDLPSVDAAKEIEDGSLDIVFIDGDHTYEGCKADIEAWFPKIRDGGWIAGHDYAHPVFPGVTQAVNELVPGFTTDTDFVWICQVNR